MKKYYLGNCLRGWYKGEFKNIEEAWNWLGKRFMLGFPTDEFEETGKIGGRNVFMYVKETNKYEFVQNLLCKSDIVYDFEKSDELIAEINKKVKTASEITLQP